MKTHLKKYWNHYLTFAVLSTLIAMALVLKRPVKVSFLDQFFIEMNIEHATIAVEEFPEVGPPARYLATFEFNDGRKLYVTPSGTCRIEE